MLRQLLTSIHRRIFRDGAVRRVARDVSAELSYHIERRTGELTRRGLDRQAAARQAAAEFGDVEEARAYCTRMSEATARREHRRDLLADIGADVRFGFRTLRTNPAFSILALLVMAGTIGANTAVFSVINAVLLRPLDYPEPERLVQVWETDRRDGSLEDPISPHDLADWREQSDVLEEIAGYGFEALALTGDGLPERIIGVETSANFFDVFGVQPAAGRAFTAAEEGPGNRAAVLSDRIWRERFGADPDILGRSVVLNGVPYTIIGVMPSSFTMPSAAEMWIPFTFDRGQLSRGSHFLFGVGRLAAGATIDDARQEMSTIAARLEAAYPSTNDGHGVNLVPLHRQIVGRSAAGLWLVFGAVALLLVIGCGNVGNMLLVRASARADEIAVRVALGAGRGRLIRQFVVEATVMSMVAGLLGMLAAAWGLDALVASLPGGVPRSAEVALSGTILAFGVALSLATGIVFGIVPVVYLGRPRSALAGTGARSTSGRAAKWVRDGIVVGEVALTLVLLVAAGLLLNSLGRLRGVDPGFQPAGLLTARLALPAERYADPALRVAVVNRLLDELIALPGAVSVGTVDSLPFSGSRSASSFSIEDDDTDPESTRNSDLREVTPGYLATMGIPLLRGQMISTSDLPDAPPVVVVNAAFARRFFGDEDALGRRIRIGSPAEVAVYGEPVWREIVGIVGDLRHDDLTVAPATEMYVPYAQHPSTRLALAIRTAGDPTSLIEPVRAAVLRADPDQPVYDIALMEARLERFLAGARANAWALTVFSATALLLAVLGIYAVVSYAVTLRAHELGVRIALGAAPADVLSLVVRQAIAQIGVGIGVGLGAALVAGAFLQALLFDVDAREPMALALPALLLAATALIACLVPVRRALAVDPAEALRRD